MTPAAFALTGALLGLTTLDGREMSPVPAHVTEEAATAQAPDEPPNPPGFDQFAAEAEAAKEARRLDEAVALYRKAIELKPDWTEGYWSLGTMFYELDRFAEARDAFRRVLVDHEENGTARALKGLCEFELKSYDTALSDLLQARSHGVVAGGEVADVARYHTAILLTRREEYEQALNVLSDFGQEGNDAPQLIEAMGLAALHMPLLPAELPGGQREMVLMAGRARYFQAARLMAAAENAFDALIARYPEAPNVHYAYGVFLLTEQQEAAIEQFTRELKVQPSHVWSKLQIAFAHIKRGEYDEARPWAEEAVNEAPTEFVARNALGQVLLETGDVEAAIRELEAGVAMAPDSPAMHFALARAYRRAGRTEDADRAQAEFTRLDRLLRASRTGDASVGGMESGAPPIKR